MNRLQRQLLHWTAFAAALILLWPCRATADGARHDTVSLQLRWDHQFQYAGFYAAEEKGFYHAEGLAVKILPGYDTNTVAHRVAVGAAEYGVGGADILLSRMQGEPLVVLAAMFQHSEEELAVHAESDNLVPADLAGKRVMADLEQNPTLKLMMRRQDVPMLTLKMVDYQRDLGAFIRGEVDALACYQIREEYELRRNGVDYRVFLPADYGIDMYGDCLFTSESEAHDNPDRVAAFRRASLRGWRYAMDHPEEIVNLILAKYPDRDHRLTHDALAFEATVMQRLVLPRLVEIGTMSAERWRRIAAEYVEAGLAEPNASLTGFIYEPEKEAFARWARRIGVVLGAVLIVTVMTLFWNVQLRRSVQWRTEELEEKNRVLVDEAEVRRNVENALRESEEKLRTLINAMPDLVLFRDAHGHWTEANTFARGLLGVDPDEANGVRRGLAGPMLPAAPFLRSEEQRVDGLAGTGGTERSEEMVVTPEGEIMVVDVIRKQVHGPDGERAGIVVIGRDVTDRKRIEEALAEANQALNAIISASPTAMVAIDGDHRVIEWNPAAEALFGLNAGEVIGSRIPGEATGGELSELWDLVLNGKPVVGRIVRKSRRDGSPLDLFTSAAALRNFNGVVLGAVGMFVDLTDTLRVQEQLRGSLAEKEVLLREVHHRVKNNLQVVSSLLSLQAEKIQDAVTRELFLESRNRVRSMALIHDRLYRSGDLARIDFGEYVRNLTETLSASYRTENQRVKVEVDADAIPVDIDLAISCGLILNELVSNAMKYAFPDGKEGKLHVSLRRTEEDTCVLQVSDDGVGLPAGLDIHKAESLGFELVCLLADQVKGTVMLDRKSGLSIAVAFNVSRRKQNSLAADETRCAGA